MMRQDTNMHPGIPPDKRVAMAIMKLASPSSLCYIANQLGMAACMVRQPNGEVCQLLKEIATNIIHQENLQEVIDGFNEKGFLNCMGALDSTHIPVLCPARSGKIYTKRKRYTSVILQVIVDHQDWFTNIFTGWTGSVHDAHMFRNSPLLALMEKGHHAPSIEETVIYSVAIPLVIVVMLPTPKALAHEAL
ncbi:hypothetical protein Y1Q_0007236 [Alligator mississippiensis]|uniref:DDE Tnp4 domain-containing protein n=1 Tax=Alligator mississippiensis TaxID=8496 RepID=A0A151NMR0_ALLMI|nr:hypothetical protein Y1Q_0007236 [Alligator mississippiensis]